MTTAISRRLALGGLAATFTRIGPASGQASPTPPAATVLEAARSEAVLVPGESPAEIWAFNGQAGGATIRLRHGDELRAILRNRTPKPLALHWQGVRGPTEMDGVGGFSQPPVAPGDSFEYRFTPPDPGVFLLRPLVLGGASEPAGRGLAGLLVVEEREPPAVDAEYAVVVRDWRVERSGALSPFGSVADAAFAGRLGNRMSAGGADAPMRAALPAGARVRLRLANGCNARTMRIRFDGIKAFVAAVDGQPTDTFEPLRSTLPFAPGTRYDLFFDMPEPGGTATVAALVGPGVPLVEFTSAPGTALDRPGAVALPLNGRLPPEIRLQNALRRDVVITGGAARAEGGQASFTGDPARAWQINGAAGSTAGPPLFSARRGQPVVLAFTNRTAFTQPMHLHGHVCRVLHPLDDGWEPYWFDTLQIPEGRTVRVAILADNPGRWLLGSSVLERLDTGLWTWFEVT